MELIGGQSILRGDVAIPGSKSHTIRAVAIAALAEGESRIQRPLQSDDAQAAVRAYSALGAEMHIQENEWRVQGTGGRLQAPDNVIDVGNSGTTMRMAMGSSALLEQGMAVLTGDEQVRRRPCGPLAASLNDLGARVRTTRGGGVPPFVIEGRLRGGETVIEAVTSQYLSSLLLNAPLADHDSTIHVSLLNERPYVEMTLDWLHRQGVHIERDGWTKFHVRGGQSYEPVRRAIPADFSSATFFLAAGALPGNEVSVHGLDMDDVQGDKAVVEYLCAMGASIEITPSPVGGHVLRVQGGCLEGCELDLNATPDALPMMAVLACFARGETRLLNVPQARLKETDRIAVMRQELERMGARVQELPDGLVIEESALHAARVEGHGDHRVVMALAVGAMAIPGETIIHGAEAVSVTYPEFVKTLASLGAHVQM